MDRTTQPEQSNSASQDAARSKLIDEFAAGSKGRAPVAALPAAGLDSKTYDYVFIGAGATGGTAAADLVDALARSRNPEERSMSVLMLEGGVDRKDPVSDIPVDHPQASEDPNLLADPDQTGHGTGYWVRQYSDQEQALKDPKARDDGMIWKPRGEGYGGSTRMNANIFIRVDDADWDALALSTGDPAYRSKNMLPLLQDLTNTEYRPVLKWLNKAGEYAGLEPLKNLGGHGFHGPLQLTTANPRLLLQHPEVRNIALKGLWWSFAHLGSPLDKARRLASAFDPNDSLAQNTEGPVLLPMTVTRAGLRDGARDILLAARNRHPEQLTLQDGARVNKVVFDGHNKVTGVLYTDPEGKSHRVNVRREAIIATGALESAALLMRSGIGPKTELDKLKTVGVSPREILEGVGKKQGFRYEIGVVERMKKPFDVVEELRKHWQADGSPVNGSQANERQPEKTNKEKDKAEEQSLHLLESTNGVVMAWQSRSKPELKQPDLFVFAVPGKFEGYKPGYSKEGAADPNLITFVILDTNKGPSNGSLEVDPKNPLGAPLINHHFHDERRKGDSSALVAGIKQVRSFVASELGDQVDREVWPGADQKTDQQLAQKVDNESWDHHPRGGTQLGDASAPDTVVDSDFKVLGTTGLRVIDASVLPNNIGSFIVSGLYQIGDLAAEKIVAEAAHAPEPAQTANRLALPADKVPATLPAARELTRKAAEAAELQGLISKREAAALSDGTVSSEDLDLTWSAIDKLLADGEKIGGNKHTIAHNLLLAESWQLNKQGAFSTWQETVKDRVMNFLGRR